MCDRFEGNSPLMCPMSVECSTCLRHLYVLEVPRGASAKTTAKHVLYVMSPARIGTVLQFTTVDLLMIPSW